jgi:hypothetical protein
MFHSNSLDRRQFLGQCAAGAAAAGLAPSLTAGAIAKPGPTAPLAMWALTGTLKSADVCRQLDAYAAVGWGVVLYPRCGLEIEYLSDAWFERIRYIVQQAAARKIEVWLYDEYCWPSGHAKGLVTKGRAELEAQVLCVNPDGQSRVEREAGSANLLMPEATRRFLDVTHERYAATIGEYFGNTVRAIFTDEPSLATYHRPRTPGDKSWRVLWSEGMDRTLGGDFRQRLAAAGSGAAEPAVWRDYWAAFARQYHDAWTMPIARWCQDHKIALSGHLLGENDFGSHVTNYGSLRMQLNEFGIPGIDEISTRWEVDRCEAMTLATIAEYPGRERMVEVFALGPCYMSMETMRRMIDVCAACGVDRYVLAICPFDLRGGLEKHAYLGVHNMLQPWFRDYARPLTAYLAEAAQRARQAQPLGVPWPSNEELWAVAGPDPRHSKPLHTLSKKFTDAAREVIRSRVAPPPVAAAPPRTKLDTQWTFAPRELNSLRIEGNTLVIVDLPSVAELSVQTQLVHGLRINGQAIDLAHAPADARFDLSYCRVPVGKLLHVGQNTLEIETTQPRPLPFLPAVVLWGNFAVDSQRRLVAPAKTIALGDWRTQGYPAFCGTGCYRATVEWAAAPVRLGLDSGGYPARVIVNGHECGRRPWGPMEFDLRNAARPGRNEIQIEIASTVGHLFVAAKAPPVGLLDVWVTG